MKTEKTIIKMPELLVFIKFFAIGFIIAEIFWSSFHLSANLAHYLNKTPILISAVLFIFALGVCLIYMIKRGAFLIAKQMISSYRFDLLVVILIGVLSNKLASPWLSNFHNTLLLADYGLALLLLILLCVVLLSPLLQQQCKDPKEASPELLFMADEEIKNSDDDLLANKGLAKSFAETVLASIHQQGLIFGVDGEWGVGKTSFINLAERHWDSADKQVIVCRFEPLRYASELDLADRLIRDITATIKNKVFIPEFKPAASRYSRLIKGKADISFLGFKLSLEPSQETVDELLDNIDEVLRRIGRRLIIVIDDLDRLDMKTMNSVLFATRRTFKLSQATYILCYDTELLVKGKKEGLMARAFLEKFVSVKQSLFVDSTNLRDFLRRDWTHIENQQSSVPSDTMIKLGAILSELAEILDGDLAENYLPLVGNLRQLKRFVNAMLLMQIEKTNLGQTDFNKRDLINLLLIHLHYPGLFRRIYAEETEGRIGKFSIKTEAGKTTYINSNKFTNFLKDQPNSAAFLLRQLFDVETLEIDDSSNIDEAIRRSRACFNFKNHRNLEKYLKLIVRFIKPNLDSTFVLYQNAVTLVKQGSSIDSILTSEQFKLDNGIHLHEEFWRVFVNQSNTYSESLINSAIDTLIKYLPSYPAIEDNYQSLRGRSINSLIILLDKFGLHRKNEKTTSIPNQNIQEIAWKIFGENNHKGNSILERLTSIERGILGWEDIMLFRLLCSADRKTQLFNIQEALIINQDNKNKTNGTINDLALKGMRKLSQKIFSIFKTRYINKKINFFLEVNETPAQKFLGSINHLNEKTTHNTILNNKNIEDQLSNKKYNIKSFVIYQLSRSNPANDLGIGCGYYDESNDKDQGGISKMMNNYIFNTCFNPNIDENNIIIFIDHCLSSMKRFFFSDSEAHKISPSKAELSHFLDSNSLCNYWREHRNKIKKLNLEESDRTVIVSNYKVSYKNSIKDLFDTLDEMSESDTYLPIKNKTNTTS